MFVHGLDQRCAVTGSARLKGESIGPFAQEEQTGSIRYGRQLLLEFFPSSFEKHMAGVFLSLAPRSFSKLPQFISNQAGWMVDKEMPM